LLKQRLHDGPKALRAFLEQGFSVVVLREIGYALALLEMIKQGDENLRPLPIEISNGLGPLLATKLTSFHCAGPAFDQANESLRKSAH
jgi:hypothetical protein